MTNRIELRVSERIHREAPHLTRNAYGEEVVARIAALSESLGSSMKIKDGRGYLAVPNGAD